MMNIPRNTLERAAKERLLQIRVLATCNCGWPFVIHRSDRARYHEHDPACAAISLLDAVLPEST